MRRSRFTSLMSVLLVVGAASAVALAGETGLNAAFQTAAERYSVPLNLLLVLGEMGSRFEDRGSEPTIEGGYGIMALRANSMGGDSLALAASLTAADAGQLKTDAAANVWGTAAVLDAYAHAAGIDRKSLEAWLPVVIRYAGLDKDSSRIFAREFYERLQSGFRITNASGETFTVEPHVLSIDPVSLAPLQVILAPPDYSGAIWDPLSCNYNATSTTKDSVVCHTIEGTAAGAIATFRNCANQVSSHYVVSESGTVWQLVREQYVAWHAVCYNNRSVGIEHEGYAGSATHPESLYVASANLIRDICSRWGIPKEKARQAPGILGHVDVTECAQCGTHTDPGRGWAFDHVVALVNQVPDRTVYIVESRSAGQNFNNYSEIGSFSDSSAKSTAYGSTGGIGSRYAYTSGNNEAIYRYTPSSSGRYRVYATWPSSTNTTTQGEFVVTHAGGSTSLVLDQNAGSNPCGKNNWNLLGEFTLNAGTEYRVRQTTNNHDGTLIRTDAVKWMQFSVQHDAPVITRHPSDATVGWGSSVTLAVAANGEGSLTYQWQKGGIDLSEGGRYSGVNSPALLITRATAAEMGSYRCVVSNPYGSTPSDAANVVVTGTGYARADLDMDGHVDQSDFGILQACFTGVGVAQNELACIPSRLDGDGDVDPDDIQVYLDCYSGPGELALIDCAG